MPRNLRKALCQVQGCRSWAMRGHAHCRSHRDAELGPHGGGAPAGNLNALKTGQHAHPLDPASLHHLARQLASDPQQLPAHLERAIASVHSRTGDPLQALIAIQATFAQLLPLVAHNLYAAEFQDLLRHIPPQRRSGLQAALCNNALPLSPQNRLRLLRLVVARSKEHLIQHRAPLPAIDAQQGPHPFSSQQETPTAQPSKAQEA